MLSQQQQFPFSQHTPQDHPVSSFVKYSSSSQRRELLEQDVGGRLREGGSRADEEGGGDLRHLRTQEGRGQEVGRPHGPGLGHDQSG